MTERRTGGPSSAAWAITRFHLGGAVRLALRSGIPVAAAATVAIGLSPDPGAAIRSLASAVADPDAGSAVPWLFALFSLGLALWGVPRVARSGAGGFDSLRSLNQQGG